MTSPEAEKALDDIAEAVQTAVDEDYGLMAALHDAAHEVAQSNRNVADAIAQAGNNIADAIRYYRTDHPLQGETFDGLVSAIQNVAEVLDLHSCGKPYTAEKPNE